MHQADVRGHTGLFRACACDPERLERMAREEVARGPKDYAPRDRRAREIVGLLLAAAASVGHVDTGGESALMMVGRDVGCVRLLLAAGADAGQTDEVGRSVLMRCMKRQVYAVQDMVGYWGKPRFFDEASEGEWTRAKADSLDAS